MRATEFIRGLLDLIDSVDGQEETQQPTDYEEEVVIVKKKREKVKEKPKKKKKKIIIEISDSESEEEEEEEPEPVKKQKPLKARDMITQQNKKSLIKVHKPAEPTNYFCD